MARLTKQEQETIVNFNAAEDTAYIYTCSQSWMTHLEKKLGLEPTATHGTYAREYECPKAWLRKPQRPRQLSESQKQKLRQRLSQKPNLTRNVPTAVGQTGGPGQ